MVVNSVKCCRLVRKHQDSGFDSAERDGPPFLTVKQFHKNDLVCKQTDQNYVFWCGTLTVDSKA